MITTVIQPKRILTVSHPSNLEVRDFGNTSIIVSYKDNCNTCEPVLFDIQGEVDLYLELHTKTD